MLLGRLFRLPRWWLVAALAPFPNVAIRVQVASGAAGEAGLLSVLPALRAAGSPCCRLSVLPALRPATAG
ncbi:hypothetical protein ACFQ0B_60720 [Nonomuraea thailandensis]